MIKIKNQIGLQEQISLLQKCIKKDLDLSGELKKLGLTYDHLRYTSNEPVSFDGKYKDLSSYKQDPHNVPAVSFFSGAGGMDIGFDYAGFTNIASVEFNELFCETLRHNFPENNVIGPPHYSGNVKDRTIIAEVLKQDARIKIPFEGVFHGGPPCQPFSIASNQRFSKNDANFKRLGFSDKEKGNLLDDYVWFIKEFRPKVFIIENVPGLKEIDGGVQLKKSLLSLSKLGYNITDPTIVNAADFGVPQKRLRLIIVGIREGASFIFPRKKPMLTACGVVFNEPISDATNHFTRDHNAESVLRYMDLALGARDKLGRVDRLHPALPSKTVIAGGTKGGGRSHLHPFVPRTISVRECARLQTFPDSYEFLGPVARQFTQVGNAVPPLLAFNLATSIYTQIFK